jgi:hypothetical protein
MSCLGGGMVGPPPCRDGRDLPGGGRVGGRARTAHAAQGHRERQE